MTHARPSFLLKSALLDGESDRQPRAEKAPRRPRHLPCSQARTSSNTIRSQARAPARRVGGDIVIPKRGVHNTISPIIHSRNVVIMGKLSKTELREELARHASERNISILEKSDEKEVAHVFGDAFAEDEMVAWVAGLDKDDPQREEKMYNLAKYMLRFVNRRCLTGKQGVAAGINSHGGGEELAGCMTITPSSCSADSMIDHIIAAFSFGMPPIYKKGEKEKYCPIASKRMEIMVPLTKARKKHMKGTARWLYLQSIGVLRSKHGEGYGSKLLRTITDTADALSVPVYLETESESNESMYHHFGFRTVEKVTMKVPGDDRSDATFSMWLMLRDPK